MTATTGHRRVIPSNRTGAASRDNTHRPTREEWTYIALTAGRSLPRTLLAAKKSNHWFISRVPVSLDRAQCVSLPADFADDFKLYAPEGHDFEALELFTPEVLETMRGTAPDFDVETADDRIIFFTRRKLDFGQSQTWEQLSALIFGVGATMVNRTGGQPASFTASTPPAQNPAARQGLRKSRISPALLLFAGPTTDLTAGPTTRTPPSRWRRPRHTPSRRWRHGAVTLGDLAAGGEVKDSPGICRPPVLHAEQIQAPADGGGLGKVGRRRRRGGGAGCCPPLP